MDSFVNHIPTNTREIKNLQINKRKKIMANV
jgi:hypothetical protein